MFNPTELWKKRFSSHMKETARYMRLIFNDHLAVVLFFMVVAFAYFYQQWLKQLPENFQADWIFAIVIGFIVTRSPIRTLLKEPDKVFLLPTEQKMSRYFTISFWYSFFVQLYLLALGFGVLTPLYLTVYSDRPKIWLVYFILLLIILKIWNMLATWWLLKERDKRNRMIEGVIRYILTGSIIFFFLQEDALLYAAINSIVFIALLLHNYYHVGRNGIAWDLLIEKEEASLQSLYRVANMFTDVPHVKRKAKKRHVFVKLLTASIPFKQSSTYDYLYKITFVRSSDYFGLYFRLLILGSILIYWIPNVWFKLGFGLLFIYLSGFQLMTLWNHHRTIQWIDIYPVSKESRKKALLHFLLGLMIVQTIIFGIVMFVFTTWQYMLYLWLIGGIFSILFVEYYAKSRLEKRKV